MEPSLSSLAALALVVALIPAVLWLLKRTPLGGAVQGGVPMKVLGVLPLSSSQRVVTVEVGAGDERRWLVLGVTPTSINTLHTLSAGSPDLHAMAEATRSGQWFAGWRKAAGAEGRNRADPQV